MTFARPKKDAVLLYLNDLKQAKYDIARWGDRPDCVGDEFGNNFRCLFCGAPPGKQCMKADATFRNYPHQKTQGCGVCAGEVGGEMTGCEKFLALHPNASACHGGGVVIIGETVWKKVRVWGGFSRRMADKRPIRRQFWRHIETVRYSAELDFETLGWQEACQLAWEDAVWRLG